MENSTNEQMTEKMIFEWDHTRDDQIIEQAFIIEMLAKSSFRKAMVARHRMFGVVLIILYLGWFYPRSGTDGLSTLIFILGITLLVGLILSRIFMGSYANSASYRAKAKRVVSFKKHIPLGKHRLTLVTGMLEWYSYADDETIKYPVRLIDRVQEQDDRVFFCRDHTSKGSIPFRAFEDEATRLNFLEAVEQSRNKAKI